jgi:hypothetical protein
VPLRTLAQKVGDSGQNLVRALFDNHPSWMCRSQDLDYGIDLEAELAPADGSGQRPSGKLLKLQVKSSEAVRRNGRLVSVTLPRSFLRYVEQFRLPVVLIVVDISTQTSWWLWLQAWLLENEAQLSETKEEATVSVRIPDDQTLETGLDSELQRVASGQHSVATVLALRELADVALSDARHLRLFEGVLSLLDDIEAPNRIQTAERIIDLLVGFGPNAGYWKSAQLVPQLVAAVKQLGNLFSLKQVLRMVCRGEAYSRAGLYGLATLYDRWPDHARKLEIPAAFNAAELEDVSWYCSVREHYPELDSIRLWAALADRKLPRTHFGNLDLMDDEDLPHRLYTKWPIRGDSVLLDNLVWVGTKDL